MRRHLEQMFVFAVDGSGGSDDGLVVEAGDARMALAAASVVIGKLRPGQLGSTRVEVVVRGWRFEFEVLPEERMGLRERAVRVGASTSGAASGDVRAMIPGRVVSVAVATGDAVSTGQPLLVVEAMKMQNEVRAPSAGVVGRVGVGVGDSVERGDILVVLERAREASPDTSQPA
jgi:biotin carboxyl carrier protein